MNHFYAMFTYNFQWHSCQILFMNFLKVECFLLSMLLLISHLLEMQLPSEDLSILSNNGNTF